MSPCRGWNRRPLREGPMSPVNAVPAKHTGLRSLMIAILSSTLLPASASAEPAKPHIKPVETDPRAVEAHQHFKQGREFLEAGAYVEAITEFEASLSLMPFPELIFNIAQAYRLKGDAKHAIERYRRFVEISPDDPIADEARTHIAALTKQISDAEQEAVAMEAARRRYDTEREERAHRRRIGYMLLGAGSALFLAGGAISGAGQGEGVLGVLGTGCIVLGVFGAIPFGTVKILYNPDPGPFNQTPVPTITRGVAFTFSF